MRIQKAISFCMPVILMLMMACHHQKKGVEATEKRKTVKNDGAKKPMPPPPAKKEVSGEWTEKLGLNRKELNNNRLYSFIDDWYASPYKFGGCQKSGVDCSCFAGILYESVYGSRLGRTATDMYKQCDKISIEDAQQGDLLFFKINSNSITHVGVYVHNSYFVHASTSKGVVLSSVNEAYYKKYIYCAGRIKKV